MSFKRSALTVALVSSALVPAVFAQTAFIEHPLPTGQSSPWIMCAGPDGAIWFGENSTNNKIGRISKAGLITEYPLTAGFYPAVVTPGPDGAVWFTYTTGIGRVTPTGEITTYARPGTPFGITAGPDGAIWFTEEKLLDWFVVRMSLDGAVTEYAIPGNSTALNIISGPDGALWFSECCSEIGRITTSGQITEFPVPTGGGDLTAGPDGAIWFSEGSKIGRLTTTGALTEYPVPRTHVFVNQIIAGRDAALWFTVSGLSPAENSERIGRLTTDGQLSQFLVPTSYGQPYGIAFATDGGLWFTEILGNRIGQLVVPSAAVSATSDATTPGSHVNLVGAGFPAGETVRIYPNGNSAALITTAVADGTGSFAQEVQIPPMPFGANSMVASGATSRHLAVAPISVSARLILEPASAAPGSSIRISGYGFGAGEDLALYWHGGFPPTVIGSPTASGLGSFAGLAAVSFTIPVGTSPGPHAITASGQLNNDSIGATAYVNVQ